MNAETILSQVYQIEQRPESILQTTQYVKARLDENEEAVPRKALVYYLDELTKYVLNLIGKGENDVLEKLAGHLDAVIESGEAYQNPMQGLSLKQKFGANLHFLYDTISLYLRADLELKDYHQLMLGGKVEDRLRELLLHFIQQRRRLNAAEVARLELYGGHAAEDGPLEESTRKCIQRDLERLTGMGMLRKVGEGTKKVTYEASPRAYAYQKELQTRQQGDGWQAPRVKKMEKSLQVQLAGTVREITGASFPTREETSVVWGRKLKTPSGMRLGLNSVVASVEEGEELESFVAVAGLAKIETFLQKRAYRKKGMAQEDPFFSPNNRELHFAMNA